jgi:beta-glucanase (GH16 family)
LVFTFSDDFAGAAGSTPDPTKWTHEPGSPDDQLEQYVNDRQHSFLDGNGHLILRATRETVTGNTIYKSARITTMETFSQSQGHFEASLKVNSQKGLWPAWWMLGTLEDWPQGGEIDFLEDFGDNHQETSVHDPTSATSKYAELSGDAAWHIYRMDWTTTSMTFSRDGKQYLTVKKSEVPHWPYGAGRPMYMILNLAVGGLVGTPPASVTFPVDITVGYVHVWK